MSDDDALDSRMRRLDCFNLLLADMRDQHDEHRQILRTYMEIGQHDGGMASYELACCAIHLAALVLRLSGASDEFIAGLRQQLLDEEMPGGGR